MHYIAKGVHFIKEAESNIPIPDCNVYILGDEKQFFLVDTGNGLSVEEKIAALQNAGYELSRCRAIILTHSHLDHINGAAALGRECWAHAADSAEINAGSEAGVFALPEFKQLAEQAGLKYNAITIGRELREGDKIHIGEHEWRVIHTPGHTPGSMCLYRKDGVLLSGDTVFGDSIGRTDFMNSSSTQMKQSLARLSQMMVTTICPGHGMVDHNVPTRIAALRDHFSPYL